jgi:mRNA interferase HicA
MSGREFMKKLKRLAGRRNASWSYDPAHGKGSHGRIYFGNAYTAIKDPKKDIGRGLLSKMCADLGIKPEDL